MASASASKRGIENIGPIYSHAAAEAAMLPDRSTTNTGQKAATPIPTATGEYHNRRPVTAGGTIGAGQAEGRASPERVCTGRRVRIGATWSLVGGWGDIDSSYGVGDRVASGTQGGIVVRPKSEGSIGSVALDGPTAANGSGSSYRRQGNVKNASATAPWATIGSRFGPSNENASCMSKTSALGTTCASGITEKATVTGSTVSDPGGDHWSFENPAAFRDAMDALGLLVGMGHQELLTLVRCRLVVTTGRNGT